MSEPLPDGDGLMAIRGLRFLGHSTPILIITARDSVEHRVVGLDNGVDDYLIKPFNDAELLTRVRAAELDSRRALLHRTLRDAPSTENMLDVFRALDTALYPPRKNGC